MENPMFNLRRNALAIGLLFAALTSGFALEPSVLIKVGQGEKLVVEIQQMSGKAEVVLLNALTETLYMEEVGPNQRSYAKTFHLGNLESGAYTVVVRTDTREIRQPFTLQGSHLALDAGKRRELFLPQIRVSEDAVELQLFNRQVATVRVSILSRDGSLVFEDVIPNVVHVGRRYNLSNLERGAYTFVVRTPERLFYQDFSRTN